MLDLFTEETYYTKTIAITSNPVVERLILKQLEIYKNYSRLSIDYLTFTKLDETRSFGNLISFAHKTKKSITYFSIGQNVPDDLIVSDSTFLIDCFMNRQCIRK